jgi:LPXTG-motif cell wall-anchored protein
MGHVVVRAGLVGLAALALAPAARTIATPPARSTRTDNSTDTAGSDGRLCTADVHSWSGRVALEPGASLHTGEIVRAQSGVQLEIDAADVSTDAPAPGQLALWIGDSAVAAGATVVGGEITATNTGAEAVTLTRVEISIAECVQVEVAPQPPVEEANVPDLPPGPPTDLPATGAPASPFAVGAALVLTGFGAVLLRLRRRPRSTAFGRGR